MRLSDKSIVVTGATGIAGAAARRFADEGARVFVVSIDPSECRALAAATRLEGWTAADLTDEAETDRAFSRAVEVLGNIDGLLAAVGGSGRRYGDGPVHQIPLAGWEGTIALNLTTTFLSVREALKPMVESGSGGSIALVSSVLATRPSSLFATHAYAAAKGAQISLMKAMASYYAPQGIRVNAIAPALVSTPMSERASKDHETQRYVTSKQPLIEGFLDADDVSHAAVYLLADESRAVTGQLIGVDGGWSVAEATT